MISRSQKLLKNEKYGRCEGSSFLYLRLAQSRCKKMSIKSLLRVTKKILYSIASWLTLLIGFYASFFYGNQLPNVSSPIYLIFAIPYFGATALFWSIFSGVGVSALLSAVVITYQWLRTNNAAYLYLQPVIGLTCGALQRVVFL